jgi:uncharacterized protein YyaL (SSP411 family)
MPNRLAASTSPYLLQHADNPVDWYPWSPEAFARAVAEDKPILLSIGYSACHWCHVMAHESFENPAIAAQLSRDFISIKVDREERPDVDAVYMEAVQAMTGHGGWPLTVFLTPAGEPFYGGTYFPPAPRHGITAFPELLDALAQAWRSRRAEVADSAGRLTEALREATRLPAADDLPGPELVAAAARSLLAAFDPREGGFGRAPKFPQPANLAFLLGRAARSRDPAMLRAVTVTLGAMARGGIWDHMGGGFHRYSVDARWAVPHFEKMLYDNAQLARIYLEAWQLTGEPLLRDVAEATLDYLLGEMTHPEGGFYAAQDADTSAGEGAFFAWTPAEVDAVLPAPEAAAAKAWFGIGPEGNFEHGSTVLATRRRPDWVARELGIDVGTLDARIRTARAALLAVRAGRERPGTDTKILTDWNGLAIDAFSRAGAVLGRPDYLAAAARAADAVLARSRLADGGLAHTWKDGRAAVPAFVEDYAAMGGACLTLYEATFDPRWIEEARALAAGMIEQFGDPDGAGFYRTGPRHEALIARQKELVDGAVPSGNALAADLLLRLGALDGDGGMTARAEGVFRAALPFVDRSPSAFGALLAAMDNHLAGMREIAIVDVAGSGAGIPASLSTGALALLDAVRARYLPGTVLACAREGDATALAAVPLLAGRTSISDRAAAYLCRGHVCGLPVTEADALAAQLGPGWTGGVGAELWADAG